MEERLPPETPYLRAFLRKLAVGVPAFDLDDLVQETMNRALRYESSYDTTQPLRQWLLAIGFRVFLDSRERAKRALKIGEHAIAAAAPASQPTSDGILAVDVGPLLAALEEPERSVMENCYLQSKSIEQIANEMGMAEGTVKSHLHRARKRLAARFEAEDWL